MGKYTTDDFKKIIKDLHLNIEILSEWVNAQTKVKCHCTIDNYEWKVYPRTVREKGCPKCNGSVTRKLTDKEYKEKLYKIHGDKITSLEPYRNMNTKILHRCNKHNYEYYAKPAHVVGRGQGCKFCAYEKIANAEKDSIEDVKRKIFNIYGNEFELSETEYKNNNTKMLFKHNLRDGSSHTFYSTATAIIQGQGCGVCHGQQISIGYKRL